MTSHLYPRNDDQEHLSPREIASRLAQFMPTVLIDWTRGRNLVNESLEKLKAIKTPSAILASHESLLDQTVYCEVSFPEFPDFRMTFIAQPDSRIKLESNAPEEHHFNRHAAEKIAAVLDYTSDDSDSLCR